MSGAATTALVGGALAATAITMLQPSVKAPTPPAVIPPPQPQAASMPDQAAIRQKGNGNSNLPGGVVDSPAGTLLTGPGGVDSSTLKLGKSTALGS